MKNLLYINMAKQQITLKWRFQHFQNVVYYNLMISVMKKILNAIYERKDIHDYKPAIIKKVVTTRQAQKVKDHVYIDTDKQ